VPRNDTRFPAEEAAANAQFGGLRDDIREGFAKTVLEAFRAAGYDCERDDALVAIAAGY
jgi:hypothetical protein